MRDLQVINRRTMMSFRGSPGPRDVARELDADVVVTSALQRTGDSVHLSVQLVRGHDERSALAESSSDGPLRDWVPHDRCRRAYPGIAAAARRGVRLTLTGRQVWPRQLGPRNLPRGLFRGTVSRFNQPGLGNLLAAPHALGRSPCDPSVPD